MSAAKAQSYRTALQFADAVADALDWPRSRPLRLAAGDPATLITDATLVAADGGLNEVSSEATHAALLAAPPVADTGGVRAGKRSYDPFVGDPSDLATWRRAERVVFDAALPLAGGCSGFDEQLALAAGLDADELWPVRAVDSDEAVLTVYVPQKAAEAVREALSAAGAGSIGNYDSCTWSTSGIGSFRPLDGANPAIGSIGKLEQVEEVRLEAVIPLHRRSAIVRALIEAHPYETPAFHVASTMTPGRTGFGRQATVAGSGASVCSDIESALAAMPGLIIGAWGESEATSGTVAVTTGSVRDILRDLLEIDDLVCVVASVATQAQLELLIARNVRVIAIDRAAVVTAFGDVLATHLSQRLSISVAMHQMLAFPDTTVDTTGSAADFSTGTWRLHFDGGSRGNPGPAAYGWVLYDPAGTEVLADGVNVGRATNNVAEWTGLLRGIEQAQQLGITRLDVRGDSELVIKQATGVYRVKNAQLKPLAEQVAALVPNFTQVTFKHVYRTDNARADEVANEAMDGVR